ncbi:MFS transporter [Gaiella sp.]|uniref:MFS transporter n=1 Tax=Gaiella sp. TaxID=2663207 RepID=UPI0039833B94
MTIVDGVKRFDLELRVLLALTVVNGVAESSLITLLPEIRSDLGLSSLEAGLALAASTLAMIVVAMPVGNVANRFGTRALLVTASILIPVALIGQALASSLPLLISARFVFGISFGIIWVIAPARAAAGGRGASGTGPLIAASGLGWLLGPVVAGVVTDAVNWRVALVVLAALAVPLIPLLLRYAEPRLDGRRLESLRLRQAFGVVRGNRIIAGAVLVAALLGIVSGASGLLIPAAFADNGLSSGRIGLAFGLAAGVWIATAALVGRLRASAVGRRGVGIAVAVMAGAWLLPAFGLSTLSLLAFLLISTACRSSINALNYAVGVRASAGDTAPAVVGMLNLAWAVMALTTPLLVGLADGSAGIRAAFALTGVAAASVAVILLAPSVSRSARAAT